MKDTKIKWYDRTWSPWRGGPLSRTSLVATKNWSEPVKWNRIAAHGTCARCKSTRDPLSTGNCRSCGEVDRTFTRPRVFPLLCDWLDDEVPVEWLVRFLQLIYDTPHLDWLLLTKRPELWRECIEAVKTFALRKRYPPRSHADASAAATAVHWLAGNPPTNVWIGVSVEDQQRADERVPALLKIPAKVRFLSVEPMLGPLDLTEVDSGRTESMRGYERRVKDNALRDRTAWGEPHRGLNWVIVGGESGPNARPCNVEWVRDIVRQCRVAKVPCFVKQLGSAPEFDWKLNDGSIAQYSCKTHWGITHPKGGDPAEWPEDLRVRQIPEVKP